MFCRTLCDGQIWPEIPLKEMMLMEEFLIAQFDMSYIDVCAYVGLTAAGLMTLKFFYRAAGFRPLQHRTPLASSAFAAAGTA